MFHLVRRLAFVPLTLAAVILAAGMSYAQQESVRPGINKPYEDPKVKEFIERFETDKREVYVKRKEVLAACKLKPGMVVADIGAGTGLFTRLLAAEVGPQGRVYAVDIARNFVEHVEKTAKEAGLNNVTGVVCTATSTGLTPGSIDLAFTSDTYHHFEFPQKTLASIHQALRAKGQLIVIDYRRIEGKTPEWLMKHMRAGQEVFTKEIQAAGFKLLGEETFLKDNYFLHFEKVDQQPGIGGPTPETCRRLADEIERHWKQDLLPRWFPRCVDNQHGGFSPHWREDWSKGDQNDKTLVFQSRMTWVCARVAMRYPELKTEYLKYTKHGADFVARVMWDGQHGGFFWGLDETGKLGDRNGGEKHVYGIGFAIYALSAAYEATKDPAALDLAKRTFAWLEEHAHDKANGGYYEALTREGRPILEGRKADAIGTRYGFKSMNSHIHLLEALSELAHVWPDPLVQTRLREVFHIVRDKVAVEPGCLNLFFTPDWRAVPDHDSFGHDVETAYLLLEAACVLKQPFDPKTLAVARSLVDHALQWGWDEQRGGFYDKGAAFSPAWEKEKIWWTQAEGLNALLLMHERFGSQTPRYFAAFQKQWDFITKYQVDHRHGGWYETVSAEGHAAPGQSKGTVWKAAYHDGRALMNVAEGLRRMGR